MSFLTEKLKYTKKYEMERVSKQTQ